MLAGLNILSQIHPSSVIRSGRFPLPIQKETASCLPTRNNLIKG